jgi:hypothetical protein
MKTNAIEPPSSPRSIPVLAFLAFLAVQPLSLVRAADPDTQPSTADWLLSGASIAPSSPPTTGPSDAPTTAPSVLRPAHEIRDESRSATMVFSDGRTITGKFSTTLRQPVRVYVEGETKYEDIPFSMIKTIEAKVLWEREEPEWKFKESGSDIKEYSGKTYPNRQTDYIFTLTDGTVISGATAAPIYLERDGEEKVFILHKRDMGKPGEKLDQLVYVKTVRFAD